MLEVHCTFDESEIRTQAATTDNVVKYRSQCLLFASGFLVSGVIANGQLQNLHVVVSHWRVWYGKG